MGFGSYYLCLAYTIYHQSKCSSFNVSWVDSVSDDIKASSNVE